MDLTAQVNKILTEYCKDVDSEMLKTEEEVAKEAMRLASHKLPLKCKFVKKEEMEA